ILFDMKVSSAATEEQFIDPPTEGILSEDLNEIIEINPVNILANDYLLNGDSIISATGHNATISEDARADSKVHKVRVQLYIQRCDSSRNTWETIVNIREYSEKNTTRVNAAQKVILKEEYYYRTRALHSVTHKGKTEQAVSSTGSIYIK